MKELIARLDELYAKATHTEWCVDTVPTQIGMCHKIGPMPGLNDRKEGAACIYVDHRRLADEQFDPKAAELHANADLIVALHNAWPQIRDALETMSADAERWRKHKEVMDADESEPLVMLLFEASADEYEAAIDSARKGEG